MITLASHRDAEAVGDFPPEADPPVAEACRLLVPEISRTVTKNKKMIHHGGR